MKLLLFAVILTFYSNYFSAAAQTSGKHSIDSTAESGMHYVFNLDFRSAESCASELQEKGRGGIPAGYLKLVSGFYKIISGAENPWDEAAFIRSHDALLEQIEKSDAIAKDESFFYTGCVFGNLARYYGAKGNWVKAFYYARKAKTQHESVPACSIFYHDARLAPGLYDYYAAILPKWLGALASMIGLGGDKERGRLMLNSTAHHGTLHRTESLFILIQILINDGKYEQALVISETLMKHYPDNPYLRHQTGLIYFLMDQHDHAEPMFRQSYTVSHERYIPCEQMSAYHLGRIEILKNRYKEASGYFQRVLSLESRTQKFIPTHGWITGSAAYYLGLSYDCAGNAAQAALAYKQSVAHAHTDPLVRERSRFRLKYQMNEYHRQAETLFHRLSYPDSGVDSASFRRIINDNRIRSQPGLFERLHFAYGKRLMLNGRFMDAAHHFEKSAEVAVEFPDRSWIIPYSHYYLAHCMATVNDIQRIQEHLRLAGSHRNYPGEERIRYLYVNILNNLTK